MSQTLQLYFVKNGSSFAFVIKPVIMVSSPKIELNRVFLLSFLCSGLRKVN